MLNTWLSDATIALRQNVDSWPQALDICARPLLEAGVIEPAYVKAIVEQHRRLGPYARPEEGAKGLGLSLLKLEQGVSFGSEEFDPVDIIIMLAAPDKHSHLEMIAALAELFSSDEDMHQLHQATGLEEIKKIIARF